MTEPKGPEIALEDMTREDYLRAEGFALYTAVNARLLDEVRAETLQGAKQNVQTRLAGSALVMYPGVLNQSNIGLHVVTNKIVNGSTIIPAGNYDFEGLKVMLGMSDEDAAGTEEKGIYKYGLDDRGFPWGFAAGVAAAAVHAFVRDGKLEREQSSTLGLGDWADLIGSGWFSRVMHSLAYTHNSIYQQFGTFPADFRQGSLETQLNDRLHYACGLIDYKIENALDTFEEPEPELEETYYTVRLNPTARTALRKAMSLTTIGGEDEDTRSSTGCPVARKATRMPRDRAMSNRHILELVDKGIFTIVPDARPDMVQIEQPLTAIDRTLMLHAEKLEEYDRRFGMPVPSPDGRSGTEMLHRKMPKTHALVRREAA